MAQTPLTIPPPPHRSPFAKPHDEGGRRDGQGVQTQDDQRGEGHLIVAEDWARWFSLLAAAIQRGSADTITAITNINNEITNIFNGDPPIPVNLPLTTKGDLLTRDTSILRRVGVGTDGQVLTADAAEETGIKWGDLPVSNPVLTAHPALFFGTQRKESHTLVTDWLKEQCILPVDMPSLASGTIVTASPGGTYNSYEAGYIALALMERNGPGEMELAEAILDTLALQGTIQRILLTAVGQDYTAGDIGTLGAGTAEVTIDTVDGDGGIVTWHLSANASGYPRTGDNTILYGGTGSGAQFAVYSDIMQEDDGSWYQQYNPYLDASGYTFDRVTSINQSGTPVSGDLKVDSGAALVAWAMAEWDRRTGGGSTRYKIPVQKALSFLRSLQVAHNTAYPGSYLIANLEWTGSIDHVAFSADSAEVLESFIAAMAAYGGTLLTSAGYSVKLMANKLYESLTSIVWTGLPGKYYTTTYPVGADPEFFVQFPFVNKEKISYTQAMCSRVNREFVDSGFMIEDASGTVTTDGSTAVVWASGDTFPTDGSWDGRTITINGVDKVIASVTDLHNLVLTTTAIAGVGVTYALTGTVDNSSQATICLDFVATIITGQWGGVFYVPYTGLPNEDQDEFAAYAGLMAKAMKVVDSARYAREIASYIAFIQWLALHDGRVYVMVDKDGLLWRSKLSAAGVTPVVEAYGFFSLDVAQCLLTEA